MMNFANQMMYLAAAIVMLGLSLTSSVELNGRLTIKKSGLYWVLSAYLITLSCFSFVLFPLVGIATLALGNLLQVGSDISLGFLFRSLNTQIKKSTIVFLFGGFLATCAGYAYVVRNGSFGVRVEFISLLTIFLSVWQLVELHAYFKKDKSFYLRFIYGAICIQICLITYRVITTGLDLNAHNTTFDESQDEFIARLVITFSYIFIFIFIGNYFYKNLWKVAVSLYANQEANILAILNSLALARDDETGHHILRTQKYVQALAKRLKKIGHYVDQLDDPYIDILYKAAPLHDIGKVGIPDHILNKPGRFSVEERNLMMTHATIGASILEVAKHGIENREDVLSVASVIAGSHHEKWDGTGYPVGLKGYAIPLAARIMAVADVYDALTAERPYKKAWTHEDALAEIVHSKGIAFDPAVVEAFVNEQSFFKEVAEAFALEEKLTSTA